MQLTLNIDVDSPLIKKSDVFSHKKKTSLYIVQQILSHSEYFWLAYIKNDPFHGY